MLQYTSDKPGYYENIMKQAVKIRYFFFIGMQFSDNFYGFRKL